MDILDKLYKKLFKKKNRNIISVIEIFEKNNKKIEKNNRKIEKDLKKSSLQSEKKSKRSKNDKKDKFKNKQVAEVKLFNTDYHTPCSLDGWDISQFQVEKVDGQVRFHDMNLSLNIMAGICEAGYKYATPIQSMILPESCKGADVFGKAQTGTGKTATFAISIFEYLNKTERKCQESGKPRVLILAPTRELVIQIEKDIRTLGKYIEFSILSVFGGINYEKQKSYIENTVIDIMVATPGRLLDFYKQGILNLDYIDVLVIDEADRMLDMGFGNEMNSILMALPKKEKRQSMLFSATLSDEISNLCHKWTNNPKHFHVESDEVTSSNVTQYAYITTDKEKLNITVNLVKLNKDDKFIIFNNKRDDVSVLHSQFSAIGIECGMLSGDVSQNKRIRTIESLRKGDIRVLIATDVASRGLHIDDVNCVINYCLPEDAEDYVHRIGRTGRAGRSGKSIMFATESDSYLIPKIEEYTQKKLEYIYPEDELLEVNSKMKKKLKEAKYIYKAKKSGKKKAKN